MSREEPYVRVVNSRAYDALIREVSGEGQVGATAVRHRLQPPCPSFN